MSQNPRISVELSRREYRRLLRQRGRLRVRKADHSPATSLFVYWHQWECIRDEWPHINSPGWQRESVRRAYLGRLKMMRYTRLNHLSPATPPQDVAGQPVAGEGKEGSRDE
ncbi:hypothetical protein LJY25_14685 [Hymenobacter sp. BT175]|uniref:hypothetical protein n=1 Tax=Hymenobacter translucens TaxID=2886507 RepID=UPI001D0F1DF0|nr:hypothetical protein [Hymenobacter translucens]MCC2547699.1 hypothetical protein [Hymenobacter translucens]